MRSTKSFLLVLLGLALALGACTPKVQESDTDAFDVDDIRNTSLVSPFAEDEVITLQNGKYVGEPFVEGGATKPVVTLLEPVVFGDLNQDGGQNAAAVMVADGGGSGSFYYLTLFSNVDGAAEHVTSTMLGDRLKVRGIGINEGVVYLEYVTQADGDAVSQPTQVVRSGYALVDGAFEQVSTEDLGSIAGTVYDYPISELLGTTWEWHAYIDFGEVNSYVVEEPAKYTLTFVEDGKYALLADCNRVNGDFISEDAGKIQFMPGAATLAACGDDSLDGEYLQKLGDVRGYLRADGQLVLNIMLDSGNMIFEPALRLLEPGEMTQSE